MLIVPSVNQQSIISVEQSLNEIIIVHPLVLLTTPVSDTLHQRLDGGVFDLGPEYNDSCGVESGSCMSQLSFQVLVLMLAKPIPRFLMDIVLP